MNILLAGTGSVAAIKYWRLMMALQELGEVKGVLTEKGEFFARKSMTPEVLDKDLPNLLVTEQDEWKWNEIGDGIPHIDLKDWADILVIAPLSANTLAKMANGICDNLLTSIVRAWPVLDGKPIVVAPAMNTNMWDNPVTKEHLDKLIFRHRRILEYEGKYAPILSGPQYNPYYNRKTRSSCFYCIDPVESILACGTKGIGAMAPISEIVRVVKIAHRKGMGIMSQAPKK